MTDESPENMRARVDKNNYKNGTRYGSLLSQVKYSGLLPTAQARDWKGAQGRGYKGEADDLPTKLMNGLLPTPTAIADPKGGCTRPRSEFQNATLAHHIHASTGATPGTTTNLNPAFVAEMMGFPPTWTERPFDGTAPEFTPHQGWDNFPTQWPTEQEKKNYEGISHSKWRNGSIKGYGNAVVPPLVLQIFKAIQAYEDAVKSD